MKQDRVLILTTHSMSECDYLSDRIAIMASGKISCIGNSLSLKNKYGPGYRITIIVSESIYIESVQESVLNIMDNSIILNAKNSIV